MVYILKITPFFCSHTQEYKRPTKVEKCQKFKPYDHLLNFVCKISLQLYPPILDETTDSPCKTLIRTMMMITTRATVTTTMMIMTMMTTIIIHI